MNQDTSGSGLSANKQKHLRRATFTFEATLNDVSRVAQALRVFLPDLVREDNKTEIELGVVEAMTNIVKHGYQNSNDGIIEVYYAVTDQEITIELRDQGMPIEEERLLGLGSNVLDFDPENLDQLPEGGMGIAIIKATFEQINYQSQNGTNLLRLTKTLTPALP